MVKRARRVTLAAFACAAAVALALALSACTPAARIDDASPRISDVQLSATSTMTEASQAVSVALTFDQAISVSGDASEDFTLLLNGKEIDSSTVQLDVLPSATGITFTLRPAQGASLGAGAGQYFALYQAQFSLSAKRSDGVLPHVTGQSGSAAVLDEPVKGTLPSGLSIAVESAEAASETTPAQTTFQVTSPAKARVITWFSPDGGATVLLKHNHTFAQASAEDAAADLAKIVNADSSLGLLATATGDRVTLTAKQITPGQVIEPVVVEGVGVSGGTYDPSQGTGA